MTGYVPLTSMNRRESLQLVLCAMCVRWAISDGVALLGQALS